MQLSLLLAGALLVLVGRAARCRAADELPASCRIRVDTGDGASLGSGTLVDVRNDAGLVLTCYHVIEGAREILIEFPNGKRHGATIVAANQAADLACLEIGKPSVAPVKLAASFTPGDELVVSGYGGEGIWRASRGVTQLRDNGAKVNLIVSTPVRPGDSGGPALNSSGELVGVVWGCNGNTYVTSGAPLHVMLTQYCEPCNPQDGGVCGPCQQQPSGGGIFGGGGLINRGGSGRLIQGADPIAIGPPAAGQPPAAAACDCGTELAAIGKRLDGIDSQLSTFAKQDELAKYLRRDELGEHVPDVSGLVKRSELPPPPDLSKVATRDEVAQIAQQADAADKTLLERIHGVTVLAKEATAAAVEGKVGVVQGFSLGRAMTSLLGIGGPAGIGIAVGFAVIGRVLKKRLAGAGGRSASGDFPDY